MNNSNSQSFISFKQIFMIGWLRLLLLLIAFPAFLCAQQTLYVVPGQSGGDVFGSSVASVGDLDSDGVSDFAVGAPGAGPIGQGGVFVFSGVDASLLFTFFGSAADDDFGISVKGLGDVTGDNVPDILVGAKGQQRQCNVYNGTAGYVRVFSGSNGSVWYTITGSTASLFGYSLDVIGDINGDQKADFIVGAPRGLLATCPSTQFKGQAFVYSGSNGLNLNQYSGSANGDGLGTSVGGVGDVNLDTIPDFAISTLAFAPINKITRIYSGLTRQQLFSVPVGVGGDSTTALAGLGDVNLDGRSDFVIGRSDVSKVEVRSGLNGSLLYPAIVGDSSSDTFGFSVARLGDFNLDGKPDFIASAPWMFGSGSQYVRIYSGVNGTLLKNYQGDVGLISRFGSALASVGDVTGDGVPDPVIGVSGDNTNGLITNGSVRVAVLPAPPNNIEWFTAVNHFAHLEG